jgi:hypothetical protein
MKAQVFAEGGTAKVALILDVRFAAARIARRGRRYSQRHPGGDRRPVPGPASRGAHLGRWVGSEAGIGEVQFHSNAQTRFDERSCGDAVTGSGVPPVVAKAHTKPRPWGLALLRSQGGHSDRRSVRIACRVIQGQPYPSRHGSHVGSGRMSGVNSTTGNTLDVFISYSQDDLDFADQIDEALQLTDFTTIIDRHGISGARSGGFPRPCGDGPIAGSIHVERCPGFPARAGTVPKLRCCRRSATWFPRHAREFAEFETNLRRERQLEGIAKAKAAGVYKGRPASIDVTKVRELKALGMGASEIAKAPSGSVAPPSTRLRLQGTWRASVAALQVTAAIRLLALRRYHQQPRCRPCATVGRRAGFAPLRPPTVHRSRSRKC